MRARRERPGARGAPERGAPALRVGFILANRFTLSALSLFVDVLRLAADEGDRSRPIRCSWRILSARPDPVRSSCGLAIGRTAPLGDPADFDHIVVVGGLLHSGQQVDGATEAYLRRAAAAGVTLVGVCTGSFVLARSGLMKGRRCCVSWYHVEDYEAEFGDSTAIADRLYLVDGDRITCSGGVGVADLAARLIEERIGRDAAQKSLHVLLLQHARAADHPQPHARAADRLDVRVQRALLLMKQHLAEPLPIDEIARAVEISTRQLERLFRSGLNGPPAAAYRALRIGHARWLLENTRKSATEVAVETGFCDCAHFSRQFKMHFGAPPSAVRSAGRSAGREAAHGRSMPRPDASVLSHQPVEASGESKAASPLD